MEKERGEELRLEAAVLKTAVTLRHMCLRNSDWQLWLRQAEMQLERPAGKDALKSCKMKLRSLGVSLLGNPENNKETRK